jgi:hypothetical protein
MKKIYGIIATCLVSSLTFGQNDQVQNKNGVDIMPVAGEIGLGMNAVPAIDWLGNMFNGTIGNTISGNKFVDYFGSQNLYGKYMLTDDNAIRAQLRYGRQNIAVTNYLFDEAVNQPDSLTSDLLTQRQTDFSIGVGYEFRRGKTRLRGIYGGELLYQFSRLKQNYYYGNGFGSTNASPLSTSWFGTTPSGTANQGTRIRSFDSGAINGLGLRLFGGVEYYICPKICIGTEFGWGIGGSWLKRSTTVDETWNALATDIETGTLGAVVTDETVTFSAKAMTIDTDNFNGALYFMFWF